MQPPRPASDGVVKVVGIINATPDSFSDGGIAFDSHDSSMALSRAIAHAERLASEGADWLDVGGESTRPGAIPVPAAEELARIRPVVAALAKVVTVPISVDTYKAEVAEVALGEGATIVNDISGGLLDPRLFSVVAAAKATLVLGHLRGTPQFMQERISFKDVVAEVTEELAGRVALAREAGIERIVVDPGLGFGKRTPENLTLLVASERIADGTACPVMIGASRKKFIGELTGVPTATERLGGSLAAVLVAAAHGASFVRVHDVAATVQALEVWHASAADPRRLR